MSFGIPELLIILLIVALLFGVGRISKLGGELGHAIANFRNGLANTSDDNSNTSET